MIVAATRKHVERMLEVGLRDSDVEELQALAPDMDVGDCLLQSFWYSEDVWVYLKDGEPMSIWGWANIPGGPHGQIWMVGTQVLDENPRILLTVTSEAIETMLQKRASLMNFVWSKNRRTLRWLKWAGATFYDPVLVEATGEYFVPFTLTRK